MNSPRRPRRIDGRGFTLLEILIAIAILGLLVGLAVANFGGVFETGRVDIANLFVTGTMKSPIENYQIRHGSYPATLDALRTDPGGLRKSWGGPFVLEDVEWPPIDPWGEPYLYKSPGDRNRTRYDLWSKGPDRESGTADDIGNWVATPAATEGSGQ